MARILPQSQAASIDLKSYLGRRKLGRVGVSAAGDQHLGETDVAGDSVAGADAACRDEAAIASEMKEQKGALPEVAADYGSFPHPAGPKSAA